MFSLRRFLLAGAALLGIITTASADEPAGRLKHVLLISVDGMHGLDLQRWIQAHPTSALAELSRRGLNYTDAYTTAPSDSFPGMIAQVTGGTPFSAGVFYDDSYDRTFFPPSSNCAGTPGAETTFAENLDYNLNDVTGGGKLGNPLSQINPANLPMTLVDGKCVVVYPHQFIRVNTIFEVLRAHHFHTAWSDKHPAYEILNGPSGTGIEDLFTPEINSQLPGAPAGQDNTTSYVGVRNYDKIKVKAVIHQIQAQNSLGYPVGYVPVIFGMNFQSVSVGQKLAKAGYGDDPSLTGGYLNAIGTPGNALSQQLAFVDKSILEIVNALKTYNRYDDTAIIISAKHGQSPIDPTLRHAIKDTYSTVLANDGYGFNIADDASLIWLDPSKRTPATLRSTLADLRAASSALGISAILDRNELTKTYRDPATDSRTPDFLVVSNKGVIYTGGSKLAEHGGLADDDRHVALLVSAPGLRGSVDPHPVFTTQIAPTILQLLGIPADELQAVQIENTRALPGLPY
ncbi:alkaline phosphatase family protein [Beijerinckia indica]|uniref:Type I phosphodiesterase/nucleotide pyrophosphatase n=1 Tax=Beijerinckia indica subsp. indica (strain ATCC 9039 / DSM 1715 / NCIMB 8712) TaxID=395963 RepID=B2IBD9_BEII9|nr:alkaline phosphatase family protein [Beijerinckia indica]ACB95226.1 type I phosphodiesterase/nucleotide pyrophosphatase [Beijerinckia indica subsp. indica ATCC 9039]